MAFGNLFAKPPRYYKPQRTTDSIVVYLAPSQPAPTHVPFELQSHVSADTWAIRVAAISRVAAQYNKPRFERAWTLLAMLSIVIVPIVLYHVLIDAFHVHFDRFGFADTDVDKLVEVRWITFGVFAGLVLLFLVPLALWKFIGQRRVNGMINGWAREDRVLRGSGTQLPVWAVKTPGVFRPTIQLTVTIPASPAPTTFHPDAYLPNYLNSASDVYLPPRSKEDPQGLPRLSTVGTFPISFGANNVNEKV
ncbi:hypothetical protein GLOTRDRAFT_110492 [Gloeophyllum trabeum ATCC 11539]|uniref:Uncharacterized protein n=1 Tax=Gloeophyllum trabeum (strain ATCC 11539 / FP-39264 / Madison 617) TaxID=670483 RepID=S7QBD3_GLOTA|nr:uncharacterized protein GLOTRDRAFT_110492 [Gloeophyllum trabeum ATCC 11539]EPQ57261.1 hypothetical protein GLOTRDRAFT_110492 [Gloeophyllum trabeum ATCC 11539]